MILTFLTVRRSAFLFNFFDVDMITVVFELVLLIIMRIKLGRWLSKSSEIDMGRLTLKDYKLRKYLLEKKKRKACIFKVSPLSPFPYVQKVLNQISGWESKTKRINNLKNTQRVKEDLQGIKEGLRGTLYLLEFSYICSLFLLANNKSISHQNNKIF